MRWSSVTLEKTIAPPAAEALAGMASARRATKTVRMLFLKKFLNIGCSFPSDQRLRTPMLGPRAVPTNDTRATHRDSFGPVRVKRESVKKRAVHPFSQTRWKVGSARAV